MVGKSRSGLANDRRGYGCSRPCPPTYKVKYDGNGSTSGQAPKDRVLYKAGFTVTVLGNTGPLAKTQHAFVEWNTKADGTGVSYSQDDTFTINEDTPLFAQWIRSYTVTYDNNYSTSGSAPIDELSPYIAGSTVTVLGNSGLLANTGFAFVNWNTERNGDGVSYSEDDTFTINEDTPLFAQWAPTYTVTYLPNDSTTGSVPVDTAQYIAGSTVTVLGNSGTLVKTDYSFAGWNTEENGSGTSYSIGPPPASFTINANVRLYAKWAPTYTVTYLPNDSTTGSVPVDTAQYIAGSTVTVLGNSGTLVKTDYSFAGWNTLENGSGTSYSIGPPPASFTINANVTLYAKWIPTYTVTYNGNGSTSGSVPAVSSYAAGSTVTVPGNTGSLMQPGLVFDSWNTEGNGDGTSYSEGDTFIINADEILYAQWIIAPLVAAPTALSSVGGDLEAYILFTQVGTITNYEYSIDGGPFLAFDPPQIYSPVNIKTLSDGVTALENGTTYTVRLKAVNSGASSSQSVSVTVFPTGTSLLSAGRLIHLDANNTNSYSGSGTAWTNLDSGGAYSATLQNSPTFDNTNKWFTFNGINQIAQIAQATVINPNPPNTPFTVQIWARVNTASPNFSSFDGLISKQFGPGSYDGYSLNLFTSGAVGLSMNGGSRNENYGPSSTGAFSNGWALYTIVVNFGGGTSNPCYVYVSGRRVLTANDIETGMQTSSAPLQFPRGIQEEPFNYCPADVGAFYLYTAALTQTQIIQNFDATKHRYNV